MKCYKCQKSGDVKSLDKTFCKECFCEVIEKRVRKEIRQENLLVKNDKVLIIDDKSVKSALNSFLLKKIINNPTIKFKTKKIKCFDLKENYDKKEEFNKIAIPWILEDETATYLKSMFENKKAELDNEKIIKPMECVTYQEAFSFAKIRNLKFGKKDDFKDDIYILIDKIEKKYPGTNFSILKTMRKTI